MVRTGRHPYKKTAEYQYESKLFRKARLERILKKEMQEDLK